MTVWHSPGSATNPRGTLPLIVSGHNFSALLFDATASTAATEAASQEGPSPGSGELREQCAAKTAAFPTKPSGEAGGGFFQRAQASAKAAPTGRRWHQQRDFTLATCEEPSGALHKGPQLPKVLLFCLWSADQGKSSPIKG